MEDLKIDIIDIIKPTAVVLDVASRVGSETIRIKQVGPHVFRMMTETKPVDARVPGSAFDRIPKGTLSSDRRGPDNFQSGLLLSTSTVERCKGDIINHYYRLVIPSAISLTFQQVQTKIPKLSGVIRLLSGIISPKCPHPAFETACRTPMP